MIMGKLSKLNLETLQMVCQAGCIRALGRIIFLMWFNSNFQALRNYSILIFTKIKKLMVKKKKAKKIC